MLLNVVKLCFTKRKTGLLFVLLLENKTKNCFWHTRLVNKLNILTKTNMRTSINNASSANDAHIVKLLALDILRNMSSTNNNMQKSYLVAVHIKPVLINPGQKEIWSTMVEEIRRMDYHMQKLIIGSREIYYLLAISFNQHAQTLVLIGKRNIQNICL